MDKKTIGILLVFVLIIGLVIGGTFLFSNKLKGNLSGEKEAAPAGQLSKRSASSEEPTSSAIQDELDQLSAQMVSDLQTEERLNLNMLGQLRSYQAMLKHIQTYAEQVEREIAIIEEISQGEFQKDVGLQAALFAGKKPQLVAKHLEEFRASRVGAILAKMKKKEASEVFDVWAKNKTPRVSVFYREAMASYLNNKRRDANPELFDKLNNAKSTELAETTR